LLCLLSHFSLFFFRGFGKWKNADIEVLSLSIVGL
jgi:hypothetical protein